jgi:DNA ligase-1
MTILEKLQAFVDASNSTNSNSDKLEVIRNYSNDQDVMKALRYVYHPLKQFHVTSANCQKRSDLVAPMSVYNDLFSMLDDLIGRNVTGHAAIEVVNRFVADNIQHADLIWCILDRNLKTRSTASMINTVVPDLIPSFDVALAKAYDEKTQKKVNWKDGWFVSRKLDGVRCLCVFDEEGNINFYSRQGNEFETLGNIKKAFAPYGLRKLVLDGEICMVDENGNEDFQGIMKQIKRKDHTIKTPKFLVFDVLHLDEFESGTSDRNFALRQAELELFMATFTTGGLVSAVDQTLVTGDSDLQNYVDLANQSGWEGLMLRKNVNYKGKRSDDILKVKQFHDAEYVVVDLEHDLHRVVVDGREVEEEMLSHVIVEHKGNRVRVGSGFNHEQRRHYKRNPELILGKTITVQYFEESRNQNGEYSLRFPVVKAIYENGRNC